MSSEEVVYKIIASMNSSSEKSVRLPMFDGAPKKFQLWWMRFLAYAMVYKFNEVISKDAPDQDMPLNEAEVSDESNDAHKKKIAAKKHNAVAMVNLSMAFTSEGTMGLVYKAMNADWPMAQLLPQLQDNFTCLLQTKGQSIDAGIVVMNHKERQCYWNHGQTLLHPSVTWTPSSQIFPSSNESNLSLPLPNMSALATAAKDNKSEPAMSKLLSPPSARLLKWMDT